MGFSLFFFFPLQEFCLDKDYFPQAQTVEERDFSEVDSYILNTLPKIILRLLERGLTRNLCCLGSPRNNQTSSVGTF